jgi:hypothetical protein
VGSWALPSGWRSEAYLVDLMMGNLSEPDSEQHSAFSTGQGSEVYSVGRMACK